MTYKPLTKQEVILFLYKEKKNSKGKYTYFPGDFYNKLSIKGSNFYLIEGKLYNLVRTGNKKLFQIYAETIEGTEIRRQGDYPVRKLFDELKNAVVEFEGIIYVITSVYASSIELEPI